METRCEQCRARLRGGGNRTSTRVLCDACYAEFSGLAAGYLAGGTVESAISTAGWAKRLFSQPKR